MQTKPTRALHPLARVGLIGLLLVSGCEDPEPPAPPAVQDAGPPETPDAAVDAGVVDAGHDAGPPPDPPRLFARRFVSKVRERPDREAFRIGYLRAGAVVQATTGRPVRADDPRCRGGWFQLTTGGYVCNGRDFIAFWGRRMPQVRGAQPDHAAPLPYEYGRNRRENTPMYRRLPTDEEAVEFEGYRIPGQPDPEEEVVGEEGGGEVAGEGSTPEAGEPASPTPAATTAPAGEGAEGAEGEEEEPEPVTLANLQGDRDSVLLRRMVNGFIVSLDRDFRAGPHRRRYWRTINNGFVPYRMLGRVSTPEFMGFRLDDHLYDLPMAFITSRNENTYLRGDDERVRRGGRASFHDRVDIVDTFENAGTTYFEARDGRLYREQDVRTLRRSPRPDEVGPREKWIEVNLSGQYLIAYEGDVPVYATLISSGRPFVAGDPEANYLTPTGTFRVRAKHLAATMDGDTASDGPYSIDDVPYVMYFQLAYAVHGAFWHRGFGHPRSHGCVNLAPRDAQWVFNWSEPHVPTGWHGAYPTEDAPGTLIWIHGETPGVRR